MKNYLKLYGFECLFLLFACMIAALSCMIQCIGRNFLTDYSSFIFSGSIYKYNLVFYILGLIVFISSIFSVDKMFFRKKISFLGEPGLPRKIVWGVIAALFGVIMIIALAASLFLILGLNDNMRPEILSNITGFGWPIFTFLYMTYIAISESRNNRT